MTASLIIVERQNALLIPQESVIADDEQRHVFVVRDELALRTPLETGLRAGDDIEVLSGLATGDNVVTRGHQKLRDKAPVRLQQQKPEKPPAANDQTPANKRPSGVNSSS